MDLWEAIWRHADQAEKAAIKAGPAREFLDAQRRGRTSCPDLKRRAFESYRAVTGVVARLAADPQYRFTARAFCDPLPHGPREMLSGALLISDRLGWYGPGGVRSRLTLDWTEPAEQYIDIELEGVGAFDVGLPQPRRLTGGRGIDDEMLLRAMEQHTRSGMTVQEAATKVARDNPQTSVEEASQISRLARKYRAKSKIIPMT